MHSIHLQTDWPTLCSILHEKLGHVTLYSYVCFLPLSRKKRTHDPHHKKITADIPVFIYR
ncbi:hypothetical protein D068_cds35570 [Bacillus atrophaeus UCMB-5137]|nr:hypothetical protein D068_cds35570 [Bacillus atrophaeus UCMB-5137]